MTLSFLSDRTAPRLRAFDERVVGLWNQANPNRQVTLTTLDHEILRGELERYLTASPTPDVLTWFAGNRMRSLVERGLMMDLAELWEAEGFTRSYAPAFRRMAQEGDAVTFLPTSYYWWAIYYRPSVFHSVGIAAPVETWDDLLGACERLRAAGKHPFALGARHRCPAAAWFDYLDLRINGPEFHRRLMALEESYRDERVRTVFDHWRTLLDGGCFAGDPGAYDEDHAVRLLMRGEAGMVLIGAYITDEYAPDAGDDLDFFRFPVFDPGLPIGEDAPVDGYFVPAATADPGAARAFLAFLGSREVQQLALDELSALPTRTDVDGRGGPGTTAKGRDMIGRAAHLSQFYDLDTPWEMADAGMDAFVAFLRDPGRIADLLGELDALRLRLRHRVVT